MPQELTHPQYIYADILIALAYADGHVDHREKDLLNSFFEHMNLDQETIEDLWQEPRSLDVIESLLREIPDEHFKHCLIKDAYLLAYADDQVQPSEHHFIKRISQVMSVNDEVKQRIHQWVQTEIKQKAEANELFGVPGIRLGA